MAEVTAAKVVDRIVAKVNDEIITLSELLSAERTIEALKGISPQGKERQDFERNTLQNLIDRKLAKAEAKRRGIAIDDKELNEALETFKKRNHLTDEASFEAALAKSGLDLKELKENIAEQLAAQRLAAVVMGTRATVSDAQVRQFYEENFKENSSTQLHLAGIKMPFPPDATDAQKEAMKKQAEGIIQEINNGASLPEIAKKNSLQEADIGYVNEKDLQPDFAKFLARLKPQEVAPILAPQGIQLIQLLDRRSISARPYSQVAPEIRNILTQREMEKQFSEWVKTLRAKAHIQIML